LRLHRWQVTLLRSYRTGELPDIEGLRLTSFLSPLSEMTTDLLAGVQWSSSRLTLQLSDGKAI
jgi:hypothetical protein